MARPSLCLYIYRIQRGTKAKAIDSTSGVDILMDGDIYEGVIEAIHGIAGIASRKQLYDGGIDMARYDNQNRNYLPDIFIK